MTSSLNTIGNMPDLEPDWLLSVILSIVSKSFLMIRFLRKRHEVNLIQVYDALERQIEGDGILGVENAENWVFISQ